MDGVRGDHREPRAFHELLGPLRPRARRREAANGVRSKRFRDHLIAEIPRIEVSDPLLHLIPRHLAGSSTIEAKMRASWMPLRQRSSASE